MNPTRTLLCPAAQDVCVRLSSNPKATTLTIPISEWKEIVSDKTLRFPLAVKEQAHAMPPEGDVEVSTEWLRGAFGMVPRRRVARVIKQQRGDYVTTDFRTSQT